MKTLLSFTFILICLQLQSQDLALLPIPEKSLQVQPAPDYFHKTMKAVNEPGFKLAGKYLEKGGSHLGLAVVIALAGGIGSYFLTYESQEAAKWVALGSGALFVVFTISGANKIKKAGRILQAY